MHQKRICEYFGLPCRHTRTFLDLPPSVRRKIYIYAGLLVGESIVLRRRPPKEPWRYLEGPDDEDKAYRFALSLLQSCPAIHDEVFGILCLENRLVVCHQHVAHGLEYLRRLSPRMCAELRAVYIHLYLKAPADPRYAGVSSFKDVKGLKPTVIAAWQKTASHVLTHAKRGRLSLHLICDTGEGEQTDAVLRPLEDHRGVLKDCHLRLYPHRINRISSLARSVALRAAGLHHDEHQPFRFMDLPPELRHRILQLTDLATPWNEVEWRPKRGFKVRFGSYRKQSYGPAADDDLVPWDPHPWQFEACSPYDGDVTGCFCQARLSGYTPACQCWRPPGSLMLVSRAMYQEAIAVLYRRNRIVVLPDSMSSKDETRQGYPLTTRLPASKFITRHMVHSVLSHLRELEIVFPRVTMPSDLDPPQDDDSTQNKLMPPFLDWRFAVEHLKELHSNLGSMTIVVHMRMRQHRHSFGRQVAGCAEPRRELLKPHNMLLEPLKKLREAGLRRLFVFIQWRSHSWTPPHLRDRAEQVDRRSRERCMMDNIEDRLEKEIMGNDYDSSRAGKLDWYPCQWMLDDE